MEIDEKLIRRLAKIARLELSDAEIKRFEPELKEILNAFSKLAEVDTKEVGASFQPVEIKNIMREDKTKHGLSQGEALSLTEQKSSGYFKGPKAIG